MRRCICLLFSCCLAVPICGCSYDTTSPTRVYDVPKPDPDELPLKGWVGKWRLVRAGGKSPAEFYIKSQEIEIGADGFWKSQIEMQPPEMRVQTIKGAGKITRDGDLVHNRFAPRGGFVAKGEEAQEKVASIRLESGKLIVEPDFFMQARKEGTDPVAGEYERMAGTAKEGSAQSAPAGSAEK